MWDGKKPEVCSNGVPVTVSRRYALSPNSESVPVLSPGSQGSPTVQSGRREWKKGLRTPSSVPLHTGVELLS